MSFLLGLLVIVYATSNPLQADFLVDSHQELSYQLLSIAIEAVLALAYLYLSR